jgi:hypothetical protein
VTVRFGAGRAELHVANLALSDQIRVPIALGPNWQTAGDPAVVSFDVVWSHPITRRVHVPAGTNGNQFAGDYVENQATVTWSGTNLATGFTFTANPGDSSTSVPGRFFAELGHEGNGIFFDPDSSGGAGAGAAFVPVLIASAPAPVPPATTLRASPGPAEGFATRVVVRAPAASVVPGPDRPVAGAAPPRVVDHVFADLDSSTLWDPFGGEAVRAGN